MNQPLGYSEEVRRKCLKMYVNGMGFRGIQRVKDVHHTTVICWVKQVGQNLPDAYAHLDHTADR
jgi:transposase-like protein